MTEDEFPGLVFAESCRAADGDVAQHPVRVWVTRRRAENPLRGCSRVLPQRVRCVQMLRFNGAAAGMHTSIELAAGASYIGWEILCLGRTASGETFDAGHIRQRTEIAVAGDLIWSERSHLAGGSRLLESAAGLGGAPISAVMLAAGRSVAPELVAQCRGVMLDGEARSGITAMPNVLVARYAGHSSEQAKAYFVALWRIVRPFYTGRAAVTPRIWNT